MRYLYAVIWLGIFGAIGWMVHTGEAAAYSGRRGQWFAELLRKLTDAVGQTTVALLMVAIGVAFAAWSVYGKDDADDSRPSE